MRGIEVISSHCCFLSLNSPRPYISGRREYYKGSTLQKMLTIPSMYIIEMHHNLHHWKAPRYTTRRLDTANTYYMSRTCNRNPIICAYMYAEIYIYQTSGTIGGSITKLVTGLKTNRSCKLERNHLRPVAIRGFPLTSDSCKKGMFNAKNNK
jgi:hypothetical protein